jgi:hypothetical protein
VPAARGEVCLDAATAARLAFGGCRSPASIAFIYGNGELPLLKPSKGAILTPNLLESGECRITSRRSKLPRYGAIG